MNLLDLIIIGIMIYGALIGFKRGLIRILFDLIALILGAILALTYFEAGALFIQQTLNLSGPIASFISFFSIWGSIWLTVSIIGRAINSGASLTLLWPLNRLGGALMGSTRAFLYTLPFLIPLAHSELELYQNSQIAKPLNTIVSERLIGSDRAKTFLESLNKKSPEAIESKKQDLLDDPNLQKLQSALGDNEKQDLQSILKNLEE